MSPNLKRLEQLAYIQLALNCTHKQALEYYTYADQIHTLGFDDHTSKQNFYEECHHFSLHLLSMRALNDTKEVLRKIFEDTDGIVDVDISFTEVDPDTDKE